MGMSGLLSIETVKGIVMLWPLIVLAWSSITIVGSESSAGLITRPFTRSSTLVPMCLLPFLTRQPFERASTYSKRTVRSQFSLMRTSFLSVRALDPAPALGVAVMVISVYWSECAAPVAALRVSVVVVLVPVTGFG